jgi:hypothetical protein
MKPIESCFIKGEDGLRKNNNAEHQWLMLVILAPWEAEIRRIMV